MTAFGYILPLSVSESYSPAGCYLRQPKTLLGTEWEVKRTEVRCSIMATMIGALPKHKEVVGCYNLFFFIIIFLAQKGQSAGTEKDIYERAAQIVKFLGGDYENLNGDFGNRAGPWLYG